jgi:aminoglycoside phosphotransferase (APT) family kinase protein
MCEKLVDNLVTIHGIDYKSIGLGEIGKPDGFVKRQVDGWFERYENAKTDDIPEVEKIIKWCNANIPPSPAPTLIHNDYKYDNIIFE